MIVLLQNTAQNLRFALPVIVISTISALLTLHKKVFLKRKSYVPLATVSFLNLTAGFNHNVDTVSQEFQNYRRTEAASAAVNSQEMTVELSLPVSQRTSDLGFDFSNV